MGDYGIKATLPGYDISGATVEQLAMTSEYASPKIKIGQTPPHFGIYHKYFATSEHYPDGETILTTINHGLGYKPMHFVLLRQTYPGVSTDARPLPSQAGKSFQIYSYATTSDLVIAVSSAGGTDIPEFVDWKFKYYIFVDNGA